MLMECEVFFNILLMEKLQKNLPSLPQNPHFITNPFISIPCFHLDHCTLYHTVNVFHSCLGFPCMETEVFY